MPVGASRQAKIAGLVTSTVIATFSYCANMERPPPDRLKSDPNHSSTAPAPIKDDDNFDRSPVDKKRRKTIPVSGMNGQPKTKQTRGRKGKLRQLPEMPLDILFEVCTSTRCEVSDAGFNSFANRYLVTSTPWMFFISPKLRKLFEISLCAGPLHPSGDKHVQMSRACQNAPRT